MMLTRNKTILADAPGGPAIDAPREIHGGTASIRTLPFGGCFLHNPINAVLRKEQQASIFTEMGLRGTPFSLSANTNHQLIDFVTGKLNFPDWLKNIVYGEFVDPPSPEKAELIFGSDLALVGMSTPTELIFDKALLNVNKVDEFIKEELSALSAEKKLVSSWRKALLESNEGARKDLSEELYNAIFKYGNVREHVPDVVRHTLSRSLNVDEMTKSVADLRDRLDMPMGMILYNFMFMPDGRPVQWPAGFKGDCIEVARRLDIPAFDFAPFVAQEGVDKVLMDDRRHWNAPYYLPLGEILFDFCTGIVDRSPKRKVPKAGSSRLERARADAPAAETVKHPDKASKPASKTGSAPKINTPKETVGKAVVAPATVATPRAYAFDARTGSYLPDHASSIFAVIVLGGAWANGFNGDPDDITVSHVPEHPGKALMFDVGLRSRGRDVASFVDLRERGGGGAKETPCAGIADQLIRNASARFQDAPPMLFFSVSKGGTGISGAGQTDEDGLLRGSAQHREVLRLVHRAREIAGAQKRRLEVAAICLLHGEYEAARNSSGSAYRRGLSLLQVQYDADIRALTGQPDPVRLYLTQTNRGSARFKTPELAMAQLNARFDNQYVHCVGPVYFAPPEARPERASMHLKASGYRRIGQLFGRFLLDDLWGHQREPLRVEEAYWIGQRTIRLRYNRAIALEQDNSRVNISDLGAGLGIDFHDGTPWSPTVEAVRLARDQDCELDVDLSAPSLGFRKLLLIAARTTGGGGVGSHHGARSGIRSSEPFDVDPLDGCELFDWACSEQVVLP
ncbi:hypothetical protein [Mesorhizobium abyssinicae]|uniref:hypothetical protein n=1 Tax=Mesorhizobium abyssinicae TaxID=1209958 RepID=UPI0033970B70